MRDSPGIAEEFDPAVFGFWSCRAAGAGGEKGSQEKNVPAGYGCEQLINERRVIRARWPVKRRQNQRRTLLL
jgi:hypothetical protein